MVRLAPQAANDPGKASWITAETMHGLMAGSGCGTHRHFACSVDAPACSAGAPAKAGSKSTVKPLKSPAMSPAPPCQRRRAPARIALAAALLCGAWLILAPAHVAHADLIATVERIKPSIVGIGTYIRTRNPAAIFTGTGFAVADGRHVVTNAHVVPKTLDAEKKETLAVLIAQDKEPFEAQLVATDPAHDLALLKISGDPLPAMQLGDSNTVREGQPVAFTGFPIGMVFGFRPATHRGTVAAITPIAMPSMTARQLNPRVISRLRDSAYLVFQLDGTAYPGNSGSPVYDPETGTVYAIINSTLVRGTREAAISNPSGISYAIPASYIVDLLRENQLLR